MSDDGRQCHPQGPCPGTPPSLCYQHRDNSLQRIKKKGDKSPQFSGIPKDVGCTYIAAPHLSDIPCSQSLRCKEAKGYCPEEITKDNKYYPDGIIIHLKILDQIPLAPFYKGGIRGIIFPAQGS